MQNMKDYFKKDYVKNCFDAFITDVRKMIEKKTAKDIKTFKKYKNDDDRLGRLTQIIEKALDIFIAKKENYEADLVSIRNNKGFASFLGYSKIISGAIDCLQDIEALDKSLNDIDMKIEENENILIDIKDYYAHRK